VTVRGLALAAAFVLATVPAIAACAAGEGPVPTMIAASTAPGRTVSAAVGLTRGELVRALGAQRLVLDDAQRPFRPPEADVLADALRSVYQVVLPDDTDEGHIVVYELPDGASAAAAAAAQAAYLASGPGSVQGGPAGTVHVIRVVGPTVVLYSWHPEGSTDERAPGIEAALETLGTGVPIPG
jgi:hypothetical protein